MTVTRAVFISLIVILVLVVPGQANTISYQGQLTTDGAPASGVFSIFFNLYESESGGSPIWNEFQNVQVENGLFVAELGTVTGLPIWDFSSVLFGGGLWLELNVDGQALSPRTKITPSPAAHVAGSLAGGIVDASEIYINGSLVIDSNGDLYGGSVDAEEVLIDGTTVVDSSGNWVGEGSTVPCDGCVDASSIGEGVYVSKSQTYEERVTFGVLAQNRATGVASCLDANDLPITGGCFVPSLMLGMRVMASYPMSWTDPSMPAEWHCTLWNTSVDPGGGDAIIICLDVP
jgi:hypothetical protein